jgi:amphi-Trp domain-containing protein
MPKADRDVEKHYSRDQIIEKLERLVQCLKTDMPFEIQVAGERLYVPATATFSIEHERGDGEQELEFQLKWKA